MSMYGAIINTLILIVLIGTLVVGWRGLDETRKNRLATQRIKGVEPFMGLWQSEKNSPGGHEKKRWNAMVNSQGATIVDTKAGVNKDGIESETVISGQKVDDRTLVLNGREGERWKIELNDIGLKTKGRVQTAKLYEKAADGKTWIQWDTLARELELDGHQNMGWHKSLPDPNGPRRRR